jgi:hypothetical protein
MSNEYYVSLLLDEIKYKHYQFKKTPTPDLALEIVRLAVEFDKIDLTQDSLVPYHKAILEALDTSLKEAKAFIHKWRH